jgi:hypothetical protein
VHTWNLARVKNGTGILASTGQQRFSNCYLDWNDIVFTAPTRVTFTGGFFLCGARIRLVAPADGALDGVFISGNQFIGDYCNFRGYGAVEADGVFTSVLDATVEGTLAEADIAVRGPRAMLTQRAAAPASSWVFNFTDLLLFDAAAVPIQAITGALVVDDAAQAPVAVVAHKAEGGIVRVEAAAAVAGSVTVSVDQSRRRGA